MSVDYPTLDEAQEKRIAAVHGGFLYQHLFAVACLLKAKASNVQSVVIERDEDVEIVLADTRIYVQVKTRRAPLIPSDLGTALDRFQLLREQHKQGLRQGTPLFVVASNRVVSGYFNYHAVPGNLIRLGGFRLAVCSLWRQALKRRSQHNRLQWSRYGRLADLYIPRPRNAHPYPEDRFASRT